ncbi:MAG: hypothetical protein WBA10_20245, partial [Elainellaceae cyanobacterium]
MAAVVMVSAVGSPENIAIQAVSSTQEQAIFLDVPYRVYADNPHWVPPLRSSEAHLFDADNDFLSYGVFQAFIATHNGTPAGRIVAAVNQRLIEKESQAVGIFGYFECIDNIAVAQALFDAAKIWLKQQGMY